MLQHTDLHGIFAATPTLLTDSAEIDYEANGKLIDFLISEGISGLVPLGGTGEYCSMSEAARIEFAEFVIKHAAGRVPVIPGLLSPGYGDALATMKIYAELGADAAMVVTPYYTNPSQEGIFEYFDRLASAADIPVVLYEIPYRTRITVQPEIIARLSRHENIIGMKACNLDVYDFLKMVAQVDERFSILSGEDTLFPLHRAAGAKGGILASVNVVPRAWQKVHEAVGKGNLDEALALHRDLMPLIDLIFAETNPAPMKTALETLGIGTSAVHIPLVPATESLAGALNEEVSRLRKKYE